MFLYYTRYRVGESSILNGTGYVVTKKFIDNLSYKVTTSTEDIELSCICSLLNEKIGYAKDAVFYDEQVEKFNVSHIQRKRWVQGSNQVFKKYALALIKSMIHKFSFQAFDMFQVLFLPYNQSVAVVFLILSYIFIIPLKYIILGIIVGYLGEVLIGIILVNYYHKSLKRLFLSILFFPFFHLSWIPIYIYAFFNTHNVWDEIKHTKAIKYEDISQI